MIMIPLIAEAEMNNARVINLELDYTWPGERGVCGFCGKEEGGYAKKDANGEWQAACWPCVRPEGAGAAQPKRKLVGTIFTDADAEEEMPKAVKKSPGIAPSTNRPKVL
jgi:hypothetical protein